ncbi:MAG: C40 family peptidase [Leptolyngbyaceae cyanobacterium bins.349]|nr:C40 family peptidase [Leptolyngbyaceae cyanobacterium bins.349]
MTFSTNTQANSPQRGSGATQYQCRTTLNLYDSPTLERLATQAAAARYLTILSPLELSDVAAVEVRLCEDNYPGWISVLDMPQLAVATTPYQPMEFSPAEIQAKIPAAIAFTQAAMSQPNEYLWGGTVAPNYDCSGLMQAAFASVGVWLPRDAYQQEAFTQPLPLTDLQPGDLIFFGPPQKATHVGLYLGNDQYIHSSGQEQGHNGIEIDVLSNEGSRISRAYYAQLRGAGRIVKSYQPTSTQ